MCAAMGPAFCVEPVSDVPGVCGGRTMPLAQGGWLTGGSWEGLNEDSCTEVPLPSRDLCAWCYLSEAAVTLALYVDRSVADLCFFTVKEKRRRH